MLNRSNLWLGIVVCLTAAALRLSAAEQVIISEFLASNNGGLRDEDNDSSDWIEIYNAGPGTVNLNGWHLTDDALDLAKWTFPATNLGPNDFLLVFASGKDRRVAGAPLHANFSLTANGEYLALVKPDGVSIATEFSPAFPPQYENVSYGLGQTVTETRLINSNQTVRVLVPTSSILGQTWTATNFLDATWLAGTNGVGYENTVPGFAVKNYKANVTVSSLADAESVIATPSKQAYVNSANASVINYFNTGSEGHYGNNATFPGFSMNVDQDDFVVEATATITIPTPGFYTFGVNSDDGFRLTIGSFVDVCDCLRGPGDTLATFAISTPGDYALRLVFFERGGGSEVEVFAAAGSYSAWDSTNFKLVGDTANGGLAVRSTPVGTPGSSSIRSAIKTDMQSRMYNKSSSAYIRTPFNVTNTNLLSLTLEMKYDDGFVAYLNGTEVARRNAPQSVQFDSAATASRTNNAPLTAERINLSSFIGLLRPGTNMLAIQGLNDATNGNDFLIEAELVEYRATPTTNFYFATPTPGAFNTSTSIAYVADTKFTPDRGFFDTNFSLSITTATAGATIYYTTNGSVPGPGNGYVYTAPISVGGTLTVRAAAYKAGFQATDVDTHTYIFVNDVVYQSTNGAAPTPEWPAPNATSGSQLIDYGMDQRVVTNASWSAEIRNDLKALPSLSIVTSLSNLFDTSYGIYMHPDGAGKAWERPASLELIYPDGSRGFHVNCGLRIRGGFSRSTDNPKHAFRIFTRDEYGVSKLKFPLFKNQNGASEFDSFDIRTFQNYSWSFGGDGNGIFLRDVFSRDTQLAMGQQGERGDYYHLYVNGQYWGLYNTDERPEASFGATYYGGDADDYDVIKVDPQSGYTVLATDGNMDAWFALWAAATNGFSSDTNYYAIQGQNPDGSINPAYANLLDLPNLIDYMLVILYGGNLDAPISAFLGNTSPNNWYGSRSRVNNGGFRFFAHDSEHTLLNVNEDRTGPFPAGDPNTGGGFPKSNPQYLWQQLSAHPDFRILVADRVQKHFFNGGALSVPTAQARFLQRSNELFAAVVCESARWGDAKTSPPLTRDNWLAAMANVWNNFLPARTATVLTQLRNQGLYPSINAPSFSTNGGVVPLGYSLVITNNNASGSIYYTLDGSDPRSRGGAISPSAILYTGPITVNTFKLVRARVRDGATWTALIEASFYPVQDYSGLLVTELMYNPPDVGVISGDELEFIELKNAGSTTLDLSGAYFSAGVTFTFTNNTRLAPGQFWVLGRNVAQLQAKYPSVVVNGIYTGKLDNGGEKVALSHALGAEILSVTYNDRAPWPVGPDGNGFSLVPRSPNSNANPDDAANWRASAAVGGSPGADDPTPPAFAPVVVNEVLTHTFQPEVDKVELYNPASTNVDLSGWFLTDDSNVPKKFRIPNGTVIAGRGFVTFSETNFNATPGATNSFSLNALGEQIYLLSGDAQTNLTGYSHGFSFGAAAQGVSFGRYINSIGEELFPAQISNTFTASNSGPRVGPVVINEIQYHPSAGNDEFVELFNTAGTNVLLYDPAVPTNTWKLDGLGYQFPTNLTLPAFGFLLLVPTNPAAFRTKYAVPSAVQIVGPYTGALQDSGEKLELKRPDAPTTNGLPMIVVDEVRYNDKLPWPVSADGAGPSLQRRVAGAFGNDPTNWFASGVSPGRTNFFNAAPLVSVTGPATNAVFVPPTNVTVTATASDSDGVVTKVEFYANGIKIGEKTNAPYSAVWTNAVSGTWSLTARAYDDNFAVSISAPLQIFVLTPVPTTLVSTGSVWKYLDNGSNQGTNWIGLTFNDTNWLSGRAELGYGDSSDGRSEATVVGYGPDPNNKYITTYFRRAFVVTNASTFRDLTVSIMRDDGAIAYLNGVEVFRNNMPAGAVTYTTLASTAIGGADEATFYPTNVNPALLIEGTNILAVEMHQSGGSSSDISFDLSLTGSKVVVPPAITLHPTNQTIPPGSNVTFTAAASGSSPLYLQWLFNGTNLPGATSASFTRTNVQTNFAGAYALMAWNSAGAVTSQVATLVVGFPDKDGDGIPDWWESANGFNINDASDANGDADGDGMTNLAEYRAGTNPRNAASVLKLQWVSAVPPRSQFVAQSNVTYAVQAASNSLSSWLSFTNILAQPLIRTVIVTDPQPATNRSKFYRVIVP